MKTSIGTRIGEAVVWLLPKWPLWLLLAVLAMFQCTPFTSPVTLGEPTWVPRSAEVVFYGDLTYCDLNVDGPGGYERASMFEIPRYLDGQWVTPSYTVYNNLGAGRSNSGQPSVYYTITCKDPTVKLWRTGTSTWGIADSFTQNLNMGTRKLLGGGALFLAAVFGYYSVRESKRLRLPKDWAE